MDPAYYEELKQQNIIHSGMLPKLDNAFTAINCGVSAVHIGHARQPGAVKRKNSSFGTLLIKNRMNTQQTIAIIGSGNIGLSLAKGLVKRRNMQVRQQIMLTRRNIRFIVGGSPMRVIMLPTTISKR